MAGDEVVVVVVANGSCRWWPVGKVQSGRWSWAPPEGGATTSKSVRPAWVDCTRVAGGCCWSARGANGGGRPPLATLAPLAFTIVLKVVT